MIEVAASRATCYARHMWKKTSASQIRNHRDCNKKWFFDKIVFPKEDNEGSPSTQLGTEVHSNIEGYITGTGQLDHPLLQMNSYLHMVKRAGVEKRVEWEFMDTDSFRVPAHGFIDLVMIDHEAKWIDVIDHKTTKDWKYAKKEAELRDDPQCQLYLWILYKEFGDGWNYSFGHHVILTKKTDVERLTKFGVTPDQIKEGKKALDESIAAQLFDSRAIDHTFVDADYKSCYKFGRCPFWDYCKGEKKVPMPSIAEMIGKKEETASPVILPSTSTLYIDCQPVPLGLVVSFEDWIADLAAEYMTEVGEHYLATKYNEGAKAVALAAHKQVLEGKRVLPTVMLCSSGNPATSFFQNFHYGHCAIVKGTR